MLGRACVPGPAASLVKLLHMLLSSAGAPGGAPLLRSSSALCASRNLANGYCSLKEIALPIMEGDEQHSRFLVSVVDPTNVWGLVSEVWLAQPP